MRKSARRNVTLHSEFPSLGAPLRPRKGVGGALLGSRTEGTKRVEEHSGFRPRCIHAEVTDVLTSSRPDRPMAPMPFGRRVQLS